MNQTIPIVWKQYLLGFIYNNQNILIQAITLYIPEVCLDGATIWKL